MAVVALLWLSRPAAAADPAAGDGQPAEPPRLEVPAETPPDPAPPAPEPVAPIDGSFEAVLREAKQRYFSGDVAGARDLLSGLEARVVAGEDAPWDLVVDALIYHGEIEYEAGE